MKTERMRFPPPALPGSGRWSWRIASQPESPSSTPSGSGNYSRGISPCQENAGAGAPHGTGSEENVFLGGKRGRLRRRSSRGEASLAASTVTRLLSGNLFGPSSGSPPSGVRSPFYVLHIRFSITQNGD